MFLVLFWCFFQIFKKVSFFIFGGGGIHSLENKIVVSFWILVLLNVFDLINA